MNCAAVLADRSRRLTAFVVFGWTMLLIVLLSAAPTGAEPRTRLVGSAFDPASVSVALSRKQADGDTRTAHAPDDDERRDTPAGAPVVTTDPCPAVTQARSDGRPAPALPDMHEAAAGSCPTGRPHGPRAPPAA